MIHAYCTAAIITPNTFTHSVKFLFQQVKPDSRSLTLNQTYQLMAKSCGFSSFQLLQQATEIFVQNSEIEDLMECIDKSKKTNISSLEISNLLSCDITCLENNGGCWCSFI